LNLPTDEKLKVADMGCGSGGKTIQRFLKEDLTGELILTTIPILL
jgi:dihydrofolate reductase